jgi:large subunit ribosomal protein L9
MTKKKLNKAISLILVENVYGLGKKNGIVGVKPGYARYLLVKKKALFHNEMNKTLMAKMEQERAEENVKKHEQRLEMIRKIHELGEIFFYVAAGDSGRIFGRITKKKIEEKLKEYGFTVSSDYIVVSQSMTGLGSYELTISFGSGILDTGSVAVDPLEDNVGLTTKIMMHIKDTTQDPVFIAAQKDKITR